ncbi:MAG: permease [Candidatus Thermoplasmatota archaeon]|nr:permease [Methanomassiliicoccales archaeon RumEn M2]MDI9379193.1 permease [Candidatus Thermoplasmatota archaeon]
MSRIWDFFQAQILGMKWLNDAVGNGLTALGIDVGGRLGGSLQFFIYDSIKIVMLLLSLIFVISYIQSYFPPERTREILGKVKGLKGNFAGAVLGTLTPFCSCSSVPLFIGFTKAGLPAGVTFSFLISSPFIDLAALIVLIGIFGPEIAIAYLVVGILLAVVGGSLIERMHMEDQIEEFARPDPVVTGGEGCACATISDSMSRKDRASYSWDQTKDTFRRVFVYILIGVGVGAIIHNWIPTDVIQSVLGQQNPFSVILATLLGVPIYADIFGTIPIAEALYAKGIGAGTILAFMMAVTATSIPSVMMLRSVMKKRLLATFFLIVVIGIIIIGYIFNFIVWM